MECKHELYKEGVEDKILKWEVVLRDGCPYLRVHASNGGYWDVLTVSKNGKIYLQPYCNDLKEYGIVTEGARVVVE